MDNTTETSIRVFNLQCHNTFIFQISSDVLANKENTLSANDGNGISNEQELCKYEQSLISEKDAQRQEINPEVRDQRV
jgi:fructose-1,6-bisphosphatase